MNSRIRLRNAADVRDLVDHLCGDLSSQQEFARNGVSRWLREKRAGFAQDGYLDQMEKNAIYLFLSVAATNAASARYLLGGTPVVSNQHQAMRYARTVGTEGALQDARLHLEYVRKGSCRGCAAHEDHHVFSEYRKMRASGDLGTYLDAVEFDAVYRQGLLITSQMLLVSLLVNPQVAGSCRTVPKDEISRVLEERVNLHWGIWSETHRSPGSSTRVPWISKILE